MMHAGLFMPGFIELIMLLGLGGGGIPLGVPPAAEDPMMAKVAPEQCIFYTTWSGMAEADAKSENQLEQLIDEPEVQQFASELEKQILESIKKAVAKEEQAALPMVDDLSGMVKMLLMHPTAIFLSNVDVNQPAPDFRGGMIVHVGQDIDKLKEKLAAYQAGFLQDMVEEVTIKDGTWYQIEVPDFPIITWGSQGEYLIIALGKGNAEKILARLDTPAPKWLTEMRGRLAVDRVSKVTFVNLKKITGEMLPVPAQIIEAYGLDNVTSYASVSGLDREGYITRSLLGTDGPPRQLLGALVEGQLDADALTPIPSDASVAASARVDSVKLLEAFISMIGQIEPRGADEIERGFAEMKRETDIDFRDDILKALGDTWRIYNSPSEGGLLITGLTGVVDLKDHDKLVAANKKLLDYMKAELKRRDHWRMPRIHTFTHAGHTAYYFDGRDDDFFIAPAWCITDKQLIVAAMPQNIKAYLSRGKDFKSLATVPDVAKQFTATPGPTAFTYCDAQQVFDVVYPIFTMFFQSLSSDLQREGISLKVSMLPSAPAIRKHLRPSMATIRKTKDGVEIVRRQTLPVSPGVMLLPMFGMPILWMM